MAILVFAPAAFAFLINSLRRSSVSGGMGQRMTSPLFCGVKPRFAAMMAFSITGIMLRSHGWIAMVRASGVVTEATCGTGVAVP